MYTELIHGDSIFAELANEWDTLASAGMTNTPFQTLAYQSTWWRHLQPPESELQSIIVRDGTGNLMAVACLYVTNEGVVHFNGCIEETDYLDLIVEAQHVEVAWSAVLDCLNSESFPDWQLLDLCNVPERSLTRSILAQLVAARGHGLVESIDEVCPVIALPASYDIYLNSLASKQRRELNRKMRRARGAEAEFTIVGRDDDLRQAVDDFLELLQQSTYAKAGWLNDGRRAVFHDVAQAAQDAGMLQLIFVEINGRKAAGLFNFDYAGRIWVYNSGLDPTAFSSLGLGVVLTGQAIEWAIENGRNEFDFLRGSETYKYHFGAEDTKVFRLTINR